MKLSSDADQGQSSGRVELFSRGQNTTLLLFFPFPYPPCGRDWIWAMAENLGMVENQSASPQWIPVQFAPLSFVAVLCHLFSLVDALSFLTFSQYLIEKKKSSFILQSSDRNAFVSMLFAVLCLTCRMGNWGNSSAPVAVNIGVHFLPQKMISVLVPETEMTLVLWKELS